MRVGVIGATGLVGQRIISILSQCDVEIVPLGRKARSIQIEDKSYFIQDIAKYDLAQLDGVMMSVDDIGAKQYRKNIKGWIIDNSTAFYQHSDVPMVVPEIYKGDRKQVVVSPNCVAIPIAMVLDVIKDIIEVKHVWGSTYQSISGAGKVALEKYSEHKGLYHTVVPAIGDIQAGVSAEEKHIVDCIHKILETDIPISIMAVRVPVAIGHGVHLRVECKRVLNKVVLLDKFRDCPYIQYKEVPVSLDVIGRPDVYIGRVNIQYNVLDMWIMSDNLIRGAAWNMCNIATKLFGVKEKESEYEKAN